MWFLVYWRLFASLYKINTLILTIIGDCSCKFQLEETLEIWTQYYSSTTRILANFIWYSPINRPKFVGVFPDCGSSSKSPVLFCESAIEFGRRETRGEYKRIDLRLSLFTIVSIYGNITVCIDLHIGRMLHHQFRYVVGPFDYLLHLLEAPIDQRYAGPF